MFILLKTLITKVGFRVSFVYLIYKKNNIEFQSGASDVFWPYVTFVKNDIYLYFVYYL